MLVISLLSFKKANLILYLFNKPPNNPAPYPSL